MKKCKWCNKITDKIVTFVDDFGDKNDICISCKEKADKKLCIRCGTKTDAYIKGKCINCIQIDNYNKQLRKNEVALGVADMEDDSDSSAGSKDRYSAAFEFTPEEYNQWVTMGKAVSNADISNVENIYDIDNVELPEEINQKIIAEFSEEDREAVREELKEVMREELRKQDSHTRNINKQVKIQNKAYLKRIWVIVKLNAAGIPLEQIDLYAKDLEELLDNCLYKLTQHKCKVLIANKSDVKKLIKSNDVNVIDSRQNIYIVEC